MFKRTYIIIILLLLPLSFINASDVNTDNDIRDDKAEFPKALDDQKWKLVCEDEFDGDKIDEMKWKHCPEWDRCDGFCKWNDEDAYVDGEGNLKLQIRKENDKIFCGAVRTKDIFEKKFGYFEIRCKMPVIHGGWCAFWMMPATGNDPGEEGKDGTEIDIFESIFADKGHVNHALHWDGYGKEHKSKANTIEKSDDLYTGFHKYALLWNENEYVFYINDKETWRTSAGGVMQVPGYLKITMEAAKWAGNIHKEELPKVMTVDYVRVYGKKE